MEESQVSFDIFKIEHWIDWKFLQILNQKFETKGKGKFNFISCQWSVIESFFVLKQSDE